MPDRKAPPKDRVKGSKTNSPGSSSSASKAKKIQFSAATEQALKNKVEKHNEKAREGRKTSLATLKAVFRRGAGAYSTSHRPGKTRNQWAMARVNAFLHLLKSGKPSNSAYTSDNDLLPASHPKSTKKSNSITASVEVADLEEELTIALRRPQDYETIASAVLAITEYSGLGYESEPAFKAAWLRALNDGEDPFIRALSMAELKYNSKDADLLPVEPQLQEGEK